ncbi:flagellar hook-length control protein FliK [Brucella sp. IR073]|uniref:flagellar hook-length control protein FliK n=1 Tax=unclassified Brucella TaxID=2632610 RepID=UPI003B986FEE
MTIKDILPQMTQSSVHVARMGGKHALHANEKEADPKEAAGFEALVRELAEKIEPRGERVEKPEEADTDEGKRETREPDPLSEFAAQAMLALDPFLTKSTETAAASAEADTLMPKAEGTKAGEKKTTADDAGDEIPVDAAIEVGADAPKADRVKPVERAEPKAEQKQASHTAVAPQQPGGNAPAVNSAASPKAEAASPQMETKGEPRAPQQPDAPSQPQRSEPAPNAERAQPATQGTSNAPSPPAAPHAPAGAAQPVRQPMHITGVDVVSERSYGVARTLHIRLQPEELGTVNARLRLVPEGLQVELMADRRDTAERLAADRDMLGKALQSAGLGDNAVVAITVTERPNSSTANMGNGQPGQQNFAAQDQSGGRSSGQPQTQMQGERNGNRDQRGSWMDDEQGQRGGASATVEAPQGRRLSRGLVV